MTSNAKKTEGTLEFWEKKMDFLSQDEFLSYYQQLHVGLISQYTHTYKYTHIHFLLNLAYTEHVQKNVLGFVWNNLIFRRISRKHEKKHFLSIRLKERPAGHYSRYRGLWKDTFAVMYVYIKLIFEALVLKEPPTPLQD